MHELLARARAARRSRRRARRARVAAGAGLRRSRCTRACCAGAAAVPVDLREPDAGGSAGAGQVIERVGARRRRPTRRRASALALVVHTSARPACPGRSSLTLGNIAARTPRLRRGARLDRAERWLCPLPLQPRGRADGPAALGDLRARPPCSGPADRDGRHGRARWCPTQLARLLDRPAAADAARACCSAARPPIRRCCPRSRRRLAGAPDLRADAGVQRGDVAESATWTPAVRCPGSRSRWPTTARSSSRGRPSRAAASCARATSAASTSAAG